MWDDDSIQQQALNPRERIARAMLQASQQMAGESDSPWASLGRAANQIAGAFVNRRINERLQARDRIKPIQQQLPIIPAKGF